MTPSSKQGAGARTYYAVPTTYTIGSEHEDLSEAVTAAKATVQRFFYPGSPASATDRLGSWRTEDGGKAFYSRAFVERRVLSATGDEPVERIEVFLTDTEKDALRESQAAA